MLWVSPMSASTWSNTEIWLPSAAGMSIPLIAISVSRPQVLRATVLPPVFGPVMISALFSPPRVKLMGTAFL